MVAVALACRCVKAGIGGIPRPRQHRHGMAVDDAGEPPAHHLVEMAKEAEPGHIGGRVYRVFPADRSGGLVQGRHRGNGSGQILGFCLAHPVGGTKEPHAQSFGQDQPISGSAGVVGVEMVRIHKAGHGEAVLHAGVGDGVAARKDPACLRYFFGTALQDRPQNVQIHALGEADQIQRGLDLTTHRVDIAQGVCRCDLPKDIGIFHHRREEIHRLHQGDVLGDLVHRRVVFAVVAHQQVRILPAAGQLFEDAAQHTRAELGRTAASGAEHDRFAHARSSASKAVRMHRTA